MVNNQHLIPNVNTSKLQWFRGAIHSTTTNVKTGKKVSDSAHITVKLQPLGKTVHTYVKYESGAPIETAIAIRGTIMMTAEGTGQIESVELWNISNEAAEKGGEEEASGQGSGQH